MYCYGITRSPDKKFSIVYMDVFWDSGSSDSPSELVRIQKAPKSENRLISPDKLTKAGKEN
jgi:hypothetical protein